MPSANLKPPQETGEIWKTIEFDENYLVSSLGRVFSMRRGIVLRPVDNGKGYVWVALTGQARGYVHRLVAWAFHGPCPPDNEVAHLNGNRSDNRADNLVWTTCSANHAHKVLHGTDSRGSRNVRACITNEQAMEIIARIRAGESNWEIADALGVRIGQVMDIARGKTWSHLSGGGRLRSKEQINAALWSKRTKRGGCPASPAIRPNGRAGDS